LVEGEKKNQPVKRIETENRKREKKHSRQGGERIEEKVGHRKRDGVLSAAGSNRSSFQQRGGGVLGRRKKTGEHKREVVRVVVGGKCIFHQTCAEGRLNAFETWS